MSTPSNASSLQSRLTDTINEWEKHAGKYFDLAERESDPLGQKFYQSSAMAYANCAVALKSLLDQTRPVLHTTQGAT